MLFINIQKSCSNHKNVREQMQSPDNAQQTNKTVCYMNGTVLIEIVGETYNLIWFFYIMKDEKQLSLTNVCDTLSCDTTYFVSSRATNTLKSHWSLNSLLLFSVLWKSLSLVLKETNNLIKNNTKSQNIKLAERNIIIKNTVLNHYFQPFPKHKLILQDLTFQILRGNFYSTAGHF